MNVVRVSWSGNGSAAACAEAVSESEISWGSVIFSSARLCCWASLSPSSSSTLKSRYIGARPRSTSLPLNCVASVYLPSASV